MAETDGSDLKFPLIEYAFSAVDSCGSIDDAIRQLLAGIVKSFGLHSVLIFEFDRKPNVVKCAYQCFRDGSCADELCGQYGFGDEDCEAWISGRTGKNGRLRILNGDASDGMIRPFSDKDKLRVQFPLLRGTDCIGAIEYVCDSGAEPDAKRLETFSSITDIFSSYLLRIRDLRRESASGADPLEYDSVTGLPQKEIFYATVVKSLTNLGRDRLAILSADFSNVKYINDKYGFKAGNDILRDFASQLYRYTNKIVSACRSYSDNFIVAIRVPPEISFETVVGYSGNAAAGIIAVLHQKYFDSNIIINVGVNFISADCTDVENAINNANIARKYSKKLRAVNGCRCLLFNESMAAELKKHADYVASVDRAITDEDFVIQLQPRCRTDNYRIVGAEALVRWKRDTGFLLPDEFIPVFEKDGCIVKMDFFVYERVCRYLRARLDAGKRVVPVSMNVSAVHLDFDVLVDYAASLIEKYRINPALLGFELTENAYTAQAANIRETIKGLKELGCRVYLDNFGTGFSSLNTLTGFDIDGVKISRKFMKETLERKDKIVISCVVDMANRLGLEAVGEGVETSEQRKFLVLNGCELMQGNYFSEPLNPEDFDRLLDSGQ